MSEETQEAPDTRTLEQKSAEAEQARERQIQFQRAAENLAGKMYEEMRIRAMTQRIPMPPELQRYTMGMMTGFASVLISLHSDIMAQTGGMIDAAMNLLVQNLPMPSQAPVVGPPPQRPMPPGAPPSVGSQDELPAP